MRSRRSPTRRTNCRTAHESTRHAASARAVTFGTRASGPQAVLGAGDGPRRTSSLRPRRRVDLLPYALVTPLTLFIVGLALVPAGYTIVASFFRVQELNPPTRFTGLDNFRRLFSDDAVRSSMGNTALSVLLVLAALQNIPGDLYEAAKLDGCSSWSVFRWITLPLARPGITIAMVQAVIVTLNVFDQPYILNGAASTGASLTMQTYFISFQNLDFGEGYALSLLITVVTLLVSLGVFKLVYRPVEF